jgi:hypothetical protein
MSIYALHKLCRDLGRDPAFRERLKQDPRAATADLPLTDEERAALLAGDVRRLHDLGVHGYLLARLARHGIAGLTPESYVQRLKGGPVDAGAAR